PRGATGVAKSRDKGGPTLRARRAARALSVTELALMLRSALETGVGTVWVGGEISNLKRPASGHLYFTLKDKQTQLAAVMFRSAAQVLVFQPTDGMDVVVRARADVYPARGSLQLYVEAMEPRGLGALTLAYEQLKAELLAEGLFADERKRPLPRWPRAVGIVTALHGAAIHDIRTVLRRRWPAATVVVRPVRVQGRGAASEIAAGIADLNRLADVDVLIVGRGGGSLEDLWAFNEEVVARAIAASTVPVVSAVGHEVDITIADFVADARAPTPTAAASLVVPDAAEVADGVARADAALRRALARRVSTARERLVALDRRLGDPARRGRGCRRDRRRGAPAGRRGGARLRPEPRAGARRGHGGLMADAAPRFEEALAELEGLVQRLEKGELPLEESLVAFERGVNLVRLLTQRLADVEQRVEVLLKTEAGKLIRRPLEDEEQ